MGYTVWDLYRLKHGENAPPCPQPHRLMLFAYAMGIVAGEVEARKFGLDRDPGRADAEVRKGVDMRLPGGHTGFKSTAGR